MIIILSGVSLLTIWTFIGYKGFVFWWTHDHDFRTDDRSFAIMMGILTGPIMWFIGYLVHGRGKGEEKVITPRRIK